MKLISSILGFFLILIFLNIAWPFILALFIVMMIGMTYFYFKTKSAFRQAEKDINNTWQQQEYREYDTNEYEAPINKDVIDVEYTERDLD